MPRRIGALGLRISANLTLFPRAFRGLENPTSTRFSGVGMFIPILFFRKSVTLPLRFRYINLRYQCLSVFYRTIYFSHDWSSVGRRLYNPLHSFSNFPSIHWYPSPSFAVYRIGRMYIKPLAPHNWVHKHQIGYSLWHNRMSVETILSVIRFNSSRPILIHFPKCLTEELL